MLPITIACLKSKQALRPLLFALPLLTQNTSLIPVVDCPSAAVVACTGEKMSRRDVLHVYQDAKIPDIAVQLEVIPSAGGFAGHSKEPAGNEYYSRRNAKYLGRDGAETHDARLIDEAEFNRIRAENQGTITGSATARLQAESIEIRVDNQEIQADLQMTKDSSVEYKREYQLYLFIDRKTGILSSVRGAPGDNNSSYPLFTPSRDSGVDYLHGDAVPASKILIGQAHGHPATMQAGKETSNEMSPSDRSTAAQLQIAIYGIDAMYEDTGAPGYINRANPDGTTNERVGWTSGSPAAIYGERGFSIGLDALKLWGRSNLPGFK